MSTSFPTSAESVDAWMQAINMARYTEQLKAAGITQARAPKKPIIQKSRRTLGSGGHERARARDAARVPAVCVCAGASPLSHSRLSRLSRREIATSRRAARDGARGARHAAPQQSAPSERIRRVRAL